MAGRQERTQDCSVAEARGRLAKARKFLEVGELVQEIAEDGVGGGKLRSAGRQARAVVEFAGGAMRL